jgi:integrase
MNLPNEVDLIQKSQQFVRAELAVRTVASYQTDWRTFIVWCAAAGRQPLPASAETLNLYITHMLGARKVASVRRYMSAIASSHYRAGHTPPDNHLALAILRGARRIRRERPLQKQPVTVEQLRGMVAPARPEPYRTRDRALLLFGFATALRRISIVNALLEHIAIGDQGMTVYVPHEKQDQTGKGRTIGVPFARDPALCAVRAVQDWIALRGEEPGYLFDGLPYERFDPLRRMNHNTVAKIVQRAAAALHLDPAQYGGHSLRAGLITAALDAGAGEVLTARHSGHRSLASLRIYLRPGDPFSANALTVIGL